MPRDPLWRPGPTTRAVNHGRAAIERILEHRDPFLFVDAILDVDLEARALRALAVPLGPVSSEFLSLEIMGQAGLCLIHFCETGSVEIARDATPLKARALKIRDAHLEAEVRPGDELTVLARLLDSDSYTATCAGQLVRDGTICAAAVMEVYLAGAS